MLSRGFVKKVVLPSLAALGLGICSLAVSAAEYTILLKPGNAMAGAVAVSLHDDGRATLVSYADKYRSKETPVPISTDEVGSYGNLQSRRSTISSSKTHSSQRLKTTR